MRRIDVIWIGIGLFAAGGIIYALLLAIGLDGTNAGIWSQAVLVGVLVLWLLTYLFRALTQTMTLNDQLRQYEDAVLQKRLEELSPEELAALQAEVEQEKHSTHSAPSDAGSPPG